MTPEEFQAAWHDLPTPTQPWQLEARETAPFSGIWIARDASNHHHLLVEVPDGTQLDLPGTHGLGVQVTRHRIPDRSDATYIDLACMDSAVAATFAAVAADIANKAGRADAGSRLSDVIRAITEWRWFWGVDPAHLTAADAIGLFGELWFLIQWSGVSPASVQAWQASEGARHDFQWPEHSVEVKATSRSGPVVHTVHNLQQLEDPENGTLYLFSLRVAHDALAANTVSSLVEIAVSALGDQPDIRADLLQKLGRRGYTPAERDQAVIPYRIMEQRLYSVVGQFPRLTQASFIGGLPAGIDNVSYELEMAACHEWLKGTGPDSWPPSPPINLCWTLEEVLTGSERRDPAACEMFLVENKRPSPARASAKPMGVL